MTTAGGTSPTSTADVFTYTASLAPTVTAISPQSGPTSGGTLVTITGTGFSTPAAAAVYFGANPATDVTVVSATTITAVSPAGTGAVHVAVYTANGGSTNTSADVFTYTSDGPEVTSVVRYGYHSQPTYLVVYFNMALDPTSAQLASNYTVVAASGKEFKVKSARYNPKTDAVTLAFSRRLYLFTFDNFTINGTTATGVKNAAGLLLDGANTGTPGSDYVTTIAPYALRGSASQRPIADLLRQRVSRLVDRVRLARYPKRA